MSPTTAASQLDLGTEFSLPRMDRVTRAINIIIWFGLANPIVRAVWEVGLWLLLAWRLTQWATPHMSGLTHWVVTITTVAVLQFAGWRLLVRPTSLQMTFNIWLFGKPEFGLMGGMASRSFRGLLRSFDGLRIEFSEQDHHDGIDALADLERTYTASVFRAKYDEAVAASKIDPAQDDWDSVWARMSDRKVDGVSLGDVLAARAPMANLLGSRLLAEQTLLLPCAAFYSLVMALLVTGAAERPDTSHILLAAQVGLTGGLVLAVIIYLNHAFYLSRDHNHHAHPRRTRCAAGGRPGAFPRARHEHHP